VGLTEVDYIKIERTVLISRRIASTLTIRKAVLISRGIGRIARGLAIRRKAAHIATVVLVNKRTLVAVVAVDKILSKCCGNSYQQS